MNLKEIYNNLVYEKAEGMWQQKSAEDISKIIEFVKSHWFYKSKVWWYAVGAIVGLYWGGSVLLENTGEANSSLLRNALMVNSACFVCYFVILLLRRFVAVFGVGDPDDVLHYLSPLSRDAERCAEALEYASTKAGAEYRDNVLARGRELLVIDQKVMAQLAWKELQQREIDHYSQACKKLHKIS